MQNLDSKTFFQWLVINNIWAEKFNQIYPDLKQLYKDNINEKYYKIEQETMLEYSKAKYTSKEQDRALRKVYAAREKELQETVTNLANMKVVMAKMQQGMSQIGSKGIKEATEYLKEYVDNNIILV